LELGRYGGGFIGSLFEGARKTVPLEEFDEGVPTLLRVFGAPVDVDAPPTPFALGPEIDGADFDLRGRGLGETDSEVCPTCGIAPFSEASDKSGTPMSAVNAAASKASRFQLSR
jgi:hypothetical protein